MKIVTVIGARPQFIKAAAVSREIGKYDCLSEVIIHTGQHYDKNMSDIFFDEMEIPKPDYFLNINGLSHGAMTGQMLEGIEKILIDEKPDYVMVYGDTNSTLAGALAAKKLHIGVIHVEAGLRSFNMEMPEEINRILTDRISNILFCPTDSAVENLKQEGYDNIDTKVLKNGDVMQDAALFYARNSADKSTVIQEHNLSGKPFVLCTIHRAENTDNESNMKGIFSALTEISSDIPVILPLHPRTKGIIQKLEIETGNIYMIDPVGYFDMIELLKGCTLVMTDSGGLQKEAFFFKKHCVTMREQTEWIELVDGGFNELAGSSEDVILQKYNALKNKESDFDVNLYGNGQACRKLVDHILPLGSAH